MQARQDIESNAAQAMQDLLLNDYNVVLGDIVQKESSPVIYFYYRDVLGRDPDQGELEYWLNKAKTDLLPTDPLELTAYLEALPEYAQRKTWKQNIINNVTTFFTQYIAATDAERDTMLTELGLTSDDVSPSLRGTEGSEAISAILEWLNSQSLHFGDSAFKTVIDLLAKEGTTKTFEEVGTDALKVDILAGIITKDTKDDLLISMFAMAKVAEQNGLTLYAEIIDFEELKSQLAINDSIILHINKNHYVLLKDINEVDGTVTYRDLSVGEAGQDITMSRAEFMEEWAGYILSKNQIQNVTNDNLKYLNEAQEKMIRGAGWWKRFWKGVAKVFSAVVAVVGVVLIATGNPLGYALLGVNILINTIAAVVRVGTWTDVIISVGATIASAAIGTAINAAGDIVGSIANAITPAAKGMFAAAVEFFKPITTIAQAISEKIGFIATFGVKTGEVAASIGAKIIAQAVSIGTNIAFQAMKIDPTLGNMASAIISGVTWGIGAPDVSVVAGAFHSGVITGMTLIGSAAGLDDNLTRLAAATSGALVGGSLNIGSASYATEYVMNNIAYQFYEEALFSGVLDIANTLGIDERVSRLAGLAIRSSLRMGFSSGGNPLDLFLGAMSGLAQGVASIGLNYATEQLNMDPLLANLGFSAIVAGIEGLLIPANSNDPTGPRKGMMENIWEKFTGNALTMIGYASMPDRTSDIYKNLDGTFNQALFDRDMGNYYWQEAVYASQVRDLSQIVIEQGLDVALNTYATALFNATAINSIVNIGMIDLKDVGTYFKRKLEEYKQNPLNTPEVQERTLLDGTKEYDVALKDEQNRDSFIGTFAEKQSQDGQTNYFDFMGYTIPTTEQVYGEWMLGPDGEGGLGQGWFDYTDPYGLYHRQDIILDEYGMPVQSFVRLINIENGQSVVFLPKASEYYFMPDGFSEYQNIRMSYYDNDELVYDYLFNNGISENNKILTNGYLFNEIAQVLNIPISTELTNDYYIGLNADESNTSYGYIVEKLELVSDAYSLPNSELLTSLNDLADSIDGLVNDPNLVGVESLVDMVAATRDATAAGMLVVGGTAVQGGTLGTSSPLSVPTIMLGATLFTYANLRFVEAYNRFDGFIHNNPDLMQYSWAVDMLGEKYGTAVETLENFQGVWEYVTQPLDAATKDVIITAGKGILSLLRLIITGIEAIEQSQQ